LHAIAPKSGRQIRWLFAAQSSILRVVTQPPFRRKSRVPAGRAERMLRFGLMAGEFAASGAFHGARRLLGGAESGAAALLSAKNARKLARRLARMRGAAMKLGQLLSLESEDILPREFADALAVLRAQADTMPASQVRRVLGGAYGKGWEARFREFDFEPLASASIGQVHRAVAADGRELALKVQYPGVARSISSDVDNVATLLHLLRLLPVELDLRGIIAEAKRQLRQEADYLQEAENLRRYAGLVASEDALRVPTVHEDLTTRRILAMDLLRGRPVEELAARGVAQERRDTVGQLLQKLVFRELFEFRFMQTDPNFANYFIEPESGRILLFDFGSAREFAPEFAARYARICRAVIADDRPSIRSAAVEIGYLRPDESDERAEGVVDLILLVCEPLRRAGAYDFASSRLAVRARDTGLDLVFRRGFLQAPPPETVFLHRKLVGSFLLCARIRAHFDCQALVLPFL
jgi:predicted unusual protein kinase regulating ubiquinone biosynthesis (AarF/ABC1/UbiB family)